MNEQTKSTSRAFLTVVLALLIGTALLVGAQLGYHYVKASACKCPKAR